MEIKTNNKLDNLLFLGEKSRAKYIEKLEMLNLEFCKPFKDADYKIKDRFYWIGYSVIALILALFVALLSSADKKIFYIVLLSILVIPLLVAIIFYYKAKKDHVTLKSDYKKSHDYILEEYDDALKYEAQATEIIPGVIFITENEQAIIVQRNKLNCEKYYEYINNMIAETKKKIYDVESKQVEEDLEAKVKSKNLLELFYNDRKEEITKSYDSLPLDEFNQYVLNNIIEYDDFNDYKIRKEEVEEVVNFYKEWKYSLTGFKMSDSDKKARLLIANAKSKKSERSNKDVEKDE